MPSDGAFAFIKICSKLSAEFQLKKAFYTNGAIRERGTFRLHSESFTIMITQLKQFHSLIHAIYILHSLYNKNRIKTLRQLVFFSYFSCLFLRCIRKHYHHLLSTKHTREQSHTGMYNLKWNFCWITKRFALLYSVREKLFLLFLSAGWNFSTARSRLRVYCVNEV